MLDALIGFSLKNRFVVLLLTAILIGLGIVAAVRLPLDAYPDITPVQVQINTVAPELSAEAVERLITFPVEYGLGGLKGLENLRSNSKFGMSQVIATFEDGTDVYFARQQISERLGEVRLPAGVERPVMGPVATALGEVYHFILTSKSRDLAELRTLQDWVVRPRLRRVPGVAEVNAWGGLAKQFEVRGDPDRLTAHGLTLDDLMTALKENNQDVGGGYIAQAGELSLVQGLGRARTVEEIARIVIRARNGVPIRVQDVAEVGIGHMIRRGGVTADGRGEVVLGIAYMRMGENTRDVTHGLDRAMADVRQALPKDVAVDVVYRRTDLVDHVLRTVERNLFEGAVLVIAVLFAFLGNLRAGLIVASAIPLSLLFAVTMMQKVGIAGSLMSLGAIDFGLIVDSSVVMVENCVRRLAGDRTGRCRLAILRDAAGEVRRPTMFGELIIMIVYLPILTLQGVEGKLFRPMALTVVFALAASMVLSLTLMPVLASIGLPRRVKDRPTLVDRLAHWLFQPMLGLGLRFPRTTLVLIGAITVGTTILGLRLGSEFVPRLSEGAIVITTVRPAGVSLDEAVDYTTRFERMLKSRFPDEVDRIWSPVGAPEIAIDQMGFQVTDVYISLKPRERWTRAKSQAELVEAMSRETDRWPGLVTIYSQPIEFRANEMIAGITTDLGIKLFGDDLNVLQSKAAEIEHVVKQIPGAADVTTEPITGMPVLQVEVDRDAVSRHGVSVRQVLDAVRAVGGITVGEIIEPDRRFPLAVRLPESYRDRPESLQKILIPTAAGGRLPLTRLAHLRRATGPATVHREWGLRRTVVEANVRGRDLGSFVEEARRRVEREVALPVGYHLEWGGQYENLVRAERRLWLVVPMALALVFSLLYLTFHSIRDAVMIFSGVLFARVGGVLGLWYMDLPFTISAGVGFIALAGASMLEGLVLVSSIRDRMSHGVSKREAIEQARLSRLRPVLMTGTVAALGFVPMMLSTGIGSEVQRPLATVVVFGMACDTFLTMLALPVLYLLFGRGPEPGADEVEADSAAAATGDDEESTHGPPARRGEKEPSNGVDAMGRRNMLAGLVAASTMGLMAGTGTARGQAFLADDIVIISKGQRSKEQARTETQLGPIPGVSAGPMNARPGAGAGAGAGMGTGPAGASRSPMGLAPPGVLSAAAAGPQGIAGRPDSTGIAPPAALPIRDAPRYGPMEVPRQGDEGPADGLTLDQAIDRVVHASYGLRTKFQEIPQAEADILSAGLRANPLIFASADGVPYGKYTPQSQGNTGYGITWVQPLDVNRKRLARLDVAQRARMVLQAQYQDAVRLEIDNLYTAYVDVLGARETVRSIEASLAVLDRTLQSIEEQHRKGELPETAVDDAAVQRDTAAVARDQALAALRQARRTLAMVLAIPPAQADQLEVRGPIRDEAPPPPPVEELARLALCTRPDLVAYRLGVGRAEADLRLARANRFEDVFVLYTPYAFQANNYDPNLRGTTSWSLGVLASLPLVNRNQGNIARAQGKINQTRIQLNGMEQQAIAEVERAALEYDSTLATVRQIERTILPRARRSRDARYRLFAAGQENLITYLGAQRAYQDVVRQYLDALIVHRRSMLRLNTAVGRRILP